MSSRQKLASRRRRRKSISPRQRTEAELIKFDVERLETRLLLATFVVTNNSDTGSGSLRDAIALANTATGLDAIEFDTDGLFATAQTITLGGTELAITDAVTITGPGANLLTIDANGGSRIFNINDGDNGTSIAVELVAMTLTGGSVSGSGGAIHSLESLTVREATISGNSASGSGGGIWSYTHTGGTTTIDSSTLSGNSAGDGGGIWSYTHTGGTTTIASSTLSGNSAGDGGGLYTYTEYGGTTTIDSSTLSGNSASSGGGIWSSNEGTTNLTSSIVAGNTATTNGPDLFQNNGSTTVTFSLIGDNTDSGLAE